MYYRWSTAHDVPLLLEIVKSTGIGLTGSSPLVAIKRRQTLTGTPLDNYYWDGVGFSASVTFLSMSEVDSTNNPGLYMYHFSQSLIQSEYMYSAYYKHTTDPVDFVQELHYFVRTTSGSEGISLYESEPER